MVENANLVPYQEELQAWFAPIIAEHKVDYMNLDTTVFLHVRTGDIWRKKHRDYPVPSAAQWTGMLRRAKEEYGCTQAVLVSAHNCAKEGPHPYIATLCHISRGVGLPITVRKGSTISDWCALAQARHLILSPSSYSFTAAWLGGSARTVQYMEAGLFRRDELCWPAYACKVSMGKEGRMLYPPDAAKHGMGDGLVSAAAYVLRMPVEVVEECMIGEENAHRAGTVQTDDIHLLRLSNRGDGGGASFSPPKASASARPTKVCAV